MKAPSLEFGEAEEGLIPKEVGWGIRTLREHGLGLEVLLYSLVDSRLLNLVRRVFGEHLVRTCVLCLPLLPRDWVPSPSRASC